MHRMPLTPTSRSDNDRFNIKTVWMVSIWFVNFDRSLCRFRAVIKTTIAFPVMAIMPVTCNAFREHIWWTHFRERVIPPSNHTTVSNPLFLIIDLWSENTLSMHCGWHSSSPSSQSWLPSQTLNIVLEIGFSTRSHIQTWTTNSSCVFRLTRVKGRQSNS